MVNAAAVRAKDIEGRENVPIIFDSGMDQESSKFVVPTGTLSDSMNYMVTTRGYTRASGLMRFDGTVDSAVSNMWFIGIKDGDSTLSNGPFTLGGRATWGTASYGTIVYYSRVSAATDYTMLGLININGPIPIAGNMILDEEGNCTWIITTVPAGAIAPLTEAVNPLTGAAIAGTVTAYLNFLNNTVNPALTAQVNVSTVDGVRYYHGEVPGTGAITGGWQFEDEVYVVRDAYAVQFGYAGVVEVKPGDLVTIPLASGTEEATVARVVLTGGNWSSSTAEGYLVFIPNSSTVDYRSLANIDLGGGNLYISGGDQIGITSSYNDEKSVYTGGLIWKATIHGWTWVDTGYTLTYDTGTNTPNVQAAPLFLPDLLDASRSSSQVYNLVNGVDDVINGVDDVVSTGYTKVGTVSQFGSGPAWSATGLSVDNGVYRTCSLNSGETSRITQCIIPAGILPQTDIKILGINVLIQGLYTGTSSPVDSNIRLVNTTEASPYQSDNRARRAALNVGVLDYYYGGDADTWGLENISAEAINSGEYAIWIQYTNNTATSGQVELDYVSVDIVYVPTTEKVWFRDADVDVSTGVIHAFQIEGGDFGTTNDAYGSMSFVGISSPTDIGVGMEMYSDATPNGLFIGQVTSYPDYNLLPAASAMVTAGSKYQTILHNFYENEEAEAIYGVTGAGPAFVFDGESFAFMKTPLIVSVDKPRHIAAHDNRLALGYATGHVVLSAVGVPNDFSGVDGASSWGTGDAVTGLQTLQGNVLGVFSEASIRSIEGSSADDGIMRVISSTTGCREYTLQNIIGPYFVDNRGVSNIETSDRYGDFSMERVTDPIKTWIQDRIQNINAISRLDTLPVHSVAIRNKNQYRVYFADGYSLVLYWRTDGKVACTIMHYDPTALGISYVPTFITSDVLSGGRERIIMGCADGKVWVVDEAEAICDIGTVSYPNCYFIVNPVNFGKPDRSHKVYHVELQGQFYGAQTVEAWADTNYTFEETSAAQHTILFGNYSNLPLFTSRNEIDSAYMPILSDGYSVKLQTTMDGSLPHTFQSMLYRVSSKGIDRNRISKTY